MVRRFGCLRGRTGRCAVFAQPRRRKHWRGRTSLAIADEPCLHACGAQQGGVVV